MAATANQDTVAERDTCIWIKEVMISIALEWVFSRLLKIWNSIESFNVLHNFSKIFQQELELEAEMSDSGDPISSEPFDPLCETSFTADSIEYDVSLY